MEHLELKLGAQNYVLETGKIAKQADGACTVQYGGTVVLVTAVVSKSAKEDQGFFPLTVDYQEKTYAAGKIPGGFFKREGRPSEKEILTSRLIDRPIRPLFPKGFLNEVQIVGIVLSHDGENDPDVLAVLGASAALSMTGAPFLGPIAAVRVGRVDGNFIINPTYAELEKSDLDLVVAGTREGVIMVESEVKELPDSIVVDAVAFAHAQLQGLIKLQEDLLKKLGNPKMKYELQLPNPQLLAKVKDLALPKIKEANKIGTKDKREEAIEQICKEVTEAFVKEGSPYTEPQVHTCLVDVEQEEVRRVIIEKKRRIDGRGYDDIRPITCEVGVLPRTHGSGLFTRGQTQSLSVVTLGTSADEQMIDALEGEMFKSFMLHYSFPPFSVGEIRPIRGPGRREIGHGALAERALKPVMPSKDEFPYTVRVVSEILESNGSSSMATVCAGTLSLMDAGVPIKAPVAGIAMGLVKEKDGTAILTDISGLEDHFGDMDFKVVGTDKGITAFQMDIKITNVTVDLIRESLAKAQAARKIVMNKILACIPLPRKELSLYAPRITVLKIDTEKIKDVIGPQGKIIKKIIKDTGVTIDIDDEGKVMVASSDSEKSKQALDIIKSLVEEPEVGRIYLGKVKRIMNFGAFCEILPGKEGLVHVSELSDKYVKNVEDEVKLGDEIMVKLVEIDSQGRLNLSRKQAMPQQQQQDERRIKE